MKQYLRHTRHSKIIALLLLFLLCALVAFLARHSSHRNAAASILEKLYAPTEKPEPAVFDERSLQTFYREHYASFVTEQGLEQLQLLRLPLHLFQDASPSELRIDKLELKQKTFRSAEYIYTVTLEYPDHFASAAGTLSLTFEAFCWKLSHITR